jgi:hypothetical protein
MQIDFVDADIGVVDVAELLADRERFNKKKCWDPEEGRAYGHSTAIFYADNMIIWSQAHGGCKYKVRPLKTERIGKAGGKRKDNYRQNRAEREIIKLKREGLNYEEIKARLLDSDDQGIADWTNERGLKDDECELKERFEKVRGGAQGSNKPEIFWSGETTDAACIEAEEALVGLGTLYERMGIIVSVARGRGRDRDGNIICFPMLKERNEYGLRRDLARCVQFTEEDKMTGGIVSIHPPMDVVRMLKSEGQTRLPVIAAMIHTPTLFHDGTILQKPGFDDKSGFLFDPKGVTFLPVMERPTKADAKQALQTLLHPLREFPFEGKKGQPSPSRSVALAFILLAP